MTPTPEQKVRGWVLRIDPKGLTAPILVRGARKGDHPVDYKRGYIYAETPEEAEEYDRAHSYA